MKVIKSYFETFSKWSGLHPNLGKSTIFFRSLKEGEKQDILQVMSFCVGKLPMKYLGVPLLARRLNVNDCKGLVDKVKRKVQDWKNRALSNAGRLQLISFVLSFMQV